MGVEDAIKAPWRATRALVGTTRDLDVTAQTVVTGGRDLQRTGEVSERRARGR